jgi:hypothetical protein
MPDYLTWEQLKDALNEVTDPRLLAEPVLFTLLDGYGNTTAYPVQVLTESTHAGDTTFTLCVGEQDWELTYNLDKDDHEGYGLRPLRQLPPGGLTLHFSEMDEDAEDVTEWFAQPNPHSPLPAPPAPVKPGSAPLFE